MGPEGGWKRRCLAAMPGSCHCSKEQIPARRDKGEEVAAVGSWPWRTTSWHGADPSRQLRCREMQARQAPGSPVPQFPMSLLSGPLAVCRALAGMLWKGGLSGVLQTLQPGISADGFRGSWGGASGASSLCADPATLPLQDRRRLRLCQQHPLLPGCVWHLPQRQQHPGQHPHLPGLHPPGTPGSPALAGVPEWGQRAPLGKGDSGAKGREGSPPTLTPHLCPSSKSILSSTAATSRWAVPTAASRVRVCGRAGAEASWGCLGSGGGWGCCRWLLTLGATGLVLMGMSKGIWFGGSFRLPLCFSCCSSPFRLLSGRVMQVLAGLGGSPLPTLPGGWV